MSKIPMVNLAEQHRQLRGEIDKALASVVDSGAFILGKTAQEFEAEFATYHGAKECIVCGNGTDALSLMLAAHSVGPGDEVITTPWTFFATVEAILERGAIPVFVDIDPKTYCIDTRNGGEAIRAKITDKTRAIMPVHIYGQLCDMETIQKVAANHKLVVLEDAAQAHGAHRDGRYAGSIGDAGSFSFYPGKNLGALGDAGCVITNNQETAERLRMVRNHGQKVKYTNEMIGRNSRMDAFQAAVLSVKLRYLKEWTERRRELAGQYNAAFSELQRSYDTIRTLPLQGGETSAATDHVFHLYTLEIDGRDKLQKKLSEAGIGSAIHYPRPLHLQPALQFLGIQKGTLPVAECVSERVISVALCPQLTNEQQKRIVEVVQQFCATSGS